MKRRIPWTMGALLVALAVLGTLQREPGRIDEPSNAAPTPPPRRQWSGSPPDTVGVWIGLGPEGTPQRPYYSLWSELEDPWEAAEPSSWRPFLARQIVGWWHPRPSPEGGDLFRPADVGHLLLRVDPWLAAAVLEKEWHYASREARLAREAGVPEPEAHEASRLAFRKLAQTIEASGHPAASAAAFLQVTDAMAAVGLWGEGEEQLQRLALDLLQSPSTAGTALDALSNAPRIPLTEADFEALARLLDGHETRWPLAVLFATQAAFEQGQPIEAWIQRAERALQCNEPRLACTLARMTWPDLRALVAPASDWKEALRMAVWVCNFDPGFHLASGSYHQGWSLLSQTPEDQKAFDCVAERAVAPAPPEGQQVRVAVDVSCPATPSGRAR